MKPTVCSVFARSSSWYKEIVYVFYQDSDGYYQNPPLAGFVEGQISNEGVIGADLTCKESSLIIYAAGTNTICQRDCIDIDKGRSGTWDHHYRHNLDA